MQEQQSILNGGPATPALPICNSSPYLRLTEVRAHRKLRIAQPPRPRRHLGLANRPLLAAIHAAELALWQATGGDVLRSSSAAGFAQAHPN